MKKVVKLIILASLLYSGCTHLDEIKDISGYSTLTNIKSIPSETGPQMETVFCPSPECEDSIIRFIQETESQIDCAFFELGLEKVLEAIEKKSKTADVRLFVDGNYYDEVSHLGFARHDSTSQLSHNKFCIKDGKSMFTGSMNPTENGAYKNNNTLVFIDSPTLISNYQTEFDELYSGIYGRGASTQTTQVNYNDQLIENYFCPEDSCADQIISEINSAKDEIYFMTFSFTHKNIAQALIDAHKRGVHVEGIFEKRMNSKYNVKPILENAGISTRYDNNSNTMHHKVFLIDNTTITGSMNPSKSGDSKNDENVLIIHSSNITQTFKEAYSQIP